MVSITTFRIYILSTHTLGHIELKSMPNAPAFNDIAKAHNWICENIQRGLKYIILEVYQND